MKKLMLFFCLAVSSLAASSQSFSPSKTTVASGEEFTISGVGESNTAYFSGTVSVMPTGWTSTPDPYAINYVSLVSQTVMNLYNAPIGGAPTSIKVKFTNTSPTNDYTVTFNLKTNVSAFPGNTTLNVLKPVTVTIKRVIPSTTTYYSVARTGTFTKNNCAPGYQSTTPISYTLPAGSATSTDSQAAADAAALTLFNNNGQANANAQGSCAPSCSSAPPTPGAITATTGPTIGSDRITLEIQAVTGALSYKWYLDGVLLQGITNRTFTRVLECDGENHIFEVQAVNPCGTSAKRSVTATGWCQ